MHINNVKLSLVTNVLRGFWNGKAMSGVGAANNCRLKVLLMALTPERVVQKAVCLGGLLAGIAFPAWADYSENVHFHGFASQGFLSSTGNNFFGNSTSGSFEFAELGLNTSWRPLDNLQFSVQALYRRAGETDDQGLRLDYGFVDYTAVSNLDSRWGLRAGRIANSVGFYNDTRDVPFTRPGILLPQSLYFDSSRLFASDGISLYGEQYTEAGEFSLVASIIRPITDADGFEAAVFGGGVSGDFDPKMSYFGRLLYDWEGGRVRAAFSFAQINLDHRPDSPPGLLSGFVRTTLYVFSLQYNKERWSLTSELTLRPAKLEGFGPLLPDNDSMGIAWYFQGGYRFAKNWEVLLRYDLMYQDFDDRSGKDFAASTGLPAHLRFAKDWTLGLNWDVTPDVSLRTELHRVNGTAWISPLENTDIGNSDRYWDLFALQLSVRF